MRKRREQPELGAARVAAMEHLRRSNPAFAVTDATLRAEEEGRYVFAVFYSDPGVPVVPPRYALIAVARDAGTVEALDTSPDSPYWIRGRK